MTTKSLLPQGTTLLVERKPIKNLYLRVLPGGQIKVTAPLRVKDEAIQAFLTARQGWIQDRLRQLEAQPVPTQRQYATGELCWLWGQPYRLQLVEGTKKGVFLEGETLCLSLGRPTAQLGLQRPAPPPSAPLGDRLTSPTAGEGGRQTAAPLPGVSPDISQHTTPRQRAALLEAWTRQRLGEAIPPVLERCQRALGVEAKEWRIKKMTTRWGSCNPRAGRIWVSLQLAERPPCCLEYLLTHELAHLLEPGHGPAFWQQVDRAYPDWRRVRKLLNQPLPATWEEALINDTGRKP